MSQAEIDRRKRERRQNKKILTMLFSLFVFILICIQLEKGGSRSKDYSDPIKREWNNFLNSGSPCGSGLFLRTSGNKVYMGTKYTAGEIIIDRDDDNYAHILEYLSYMSSSRKEWAQRIRTGKRFYVDETCIDWASQTKQ